MVNHHPLLDDTLVEELWTIFHSCGRAHHRMIISLIIEHLKFISGDDLGGVPGLLNKGRVRHRRMSSISDARIPGHRPISACSGWLRSHGRPRSLLLPGPRLRRSTDAAITATLRSAATTAPAPPTPALLQEVPQTRRFSELKGTPLLGSRLPRYKVPSPSWNTWRTGWCIRQTARLVGVEQDTVIRYAPPLAGEHARQLHDELVAFSPSDP